MKLRLFYDFQEKSTKVELIEEIYVGKMYIPKGFVSDGRQYSSFVLETVFTFRLQIFEILYKARFHLCHWNQRQKNGRYFAQKRFRKSSNEFFPDDGQFIFQ